MTETFSRLVWAVLPSLLVALYMAQYNRKQKKKEMNEQEEREAQRKGELIKLDLLVASATLSYACAVAMKRGYANGEVEEGVKNYTKAIGNFREYEREQLARKG